MKIVASLRLLAVSTNHAYIPSTLSNNHIINDLLKQSTGSSANSSLKMSTATSIQRKNVVVDPFCFRQFAENESSKNYGGNVYNISIAEFEDIVNGRYDESKLKDGYAPFCKHLFIVNDFLPDIKVNVMPITSDNEHLLRTKYEARNEKELPVLVRYFPKELVSSSMDLPTAKYLDLILYSREQIQQENAAQGTITNSDDEELAPWGIVSIKAQDIDMELPMTPITAMRNALGKEEGGSGIPIDRKAYMEAVDYWKDKATIS